MSQATNTEEWQLPAARSWMQLPLAVVAFVLWGVQPIVGTMVLLGMFALWSPPGMAWRPVKPLPVLAFYLPFAIVWLAFAIGYLRLMPTDPQPLLQQMAEQGTAMPDFWLWIVIAVVLAPIGEEIAFRGYLFTALQSVLPMWVTQLLTATIFGLVHGWGHALPIGVLSLLFGYLRQRYRSILPSMLAHATHNGISVILVVTNPSLLDLFYQR